MAINTVIHGFSKNDALALKSLLKQQNTRHNQKFPIAMDGALICVATTGVPARVGSTLGKADVARKFLDQSGSSDRVITDYSENITAYNLATTAVATGAYIIVSRINGVWVVIWEACP